MGIKPTADQLRKELDYDPETGVFHWKKPGPYRRSNLVAGTMRPDGYRTVSVAGRYYLSHRLAWLYVYGEWPTSGLDHINRDPSDNRIENLRLATQSQNLANMSIRKTNTSGHKGVCWDKSMRKWQARVRLEHFGYFENKEDAVNAYAVAAKRIFGEFSC